MISQEVITSPFKANKRMLPLYPELSLFGFMYGIAGEPRFLCVINDMNYLPPYPAIFVFIYFFDVREHAQSMKMYFLGYPWRIDHFKNVREC